MTPFDSYEISPCRRFDEPDRPGHYYFEVCGPADADVWTLYGHLPEGGVEAIGDFATRGHAEDTFRRITGVPFGPPDVIAARLRLMHAADDLLDALCTALPYLENALHDPCFKQGAVARDVRAIRAAIARADGGAAC